MRWRLRLRERGGCRARAAGPMGGLGLEGVTRAPGRLLTIVDRPVLELPIASGGAGGWQSCSCLPSLRPTGTPAATVAAIVRPVVSSAVLPRAMHNSFQLHQQLLAAACGAAGKQSCCSAVDGRAADPACVFMRVRACVRP